MVIIISMSMRSYVLEMDQDLLGEEEKGNKRKERTGWLEREFDKLTDARSTMSL